MEETVEMEIRPRSEG
jgi:hypothetical protein